MSGPPGQVLGLEMVRSPVAHKVHAHCLLLHRRRLCTSWAAPAGGCWHCAQLNEMTHRAVGSLGEKPCMHKGQQALETPAGGHGEGAHPTAPPSLTECFRPSTRLVNLRHPPPPPPPPTPRHMSVKSFKPCMSP